jgi:cytochrome c biogenesis protein CcmG/thiol:disulfide interchange protein DsbE
MRAELTAVFALILTGLLSGALSFAPHPAEAAESAERLDRFIGAPAPGFKLKRLDPEGGTLKLSDLKGKAVVLNFWATWCGPCKLEMPLLIRLQKKYGPQGLRIVGIEMDETDGKAAAAFAREIGTNYPIAIGTEAIAKLYGGIDGLPATFFVDRSGKIAAHTLGGRSEDAIESDIRSILGRTNTAAASPPAAP